MPEASRKFVRLAAALVCAAIGAASPGRAAEFSAGGFQFSDELGGFRLISATGMGTVADPIVLTEEFDDVTPATLVIRNHAILGEGMRSGQIEFALVKRIVNRSNRVWAAFEFELQEQLRKPSVYSDGLSFKQFGAESKDVRSDSFFDNERLFEPYDRIEFRNGHVDPGKTVSFMVTITDPTPVPEFYLVQDPKLLSAEFGRPSRSLASR